MSESGQEMGALHDAKRTVRTVSLGTVWRALRYPFILLSFALIPKMMGDTDYGRYAYFVSVFVLLDMATDLGFLQVFGRYVPECLAANDTSRLQRLFNGLFGYGILLSVLMAAIVFVAHLLRPLSGFTAFTLSGLTLMLILTRIEGTFFCLLYGLNRIARFSAKEAIRSAATLVFVLLLYRRYGFGGALMGLVLNEVLLAALGGWWIRDYLAGLKPAFRWSDLKPYALFGLSFYIPAFFFGMLQRAGNVFTQWWTGSSEQVAYYDVANQYLLLTATFLGLILQTLLPALTHLHLRSDRTGVQRWQRAVLTYCTVAAALAFNALLWLGEPFVRQWLGSAYQPVIPNAKVLSLAMIPVLLSYAGMNYALLEKSARVYLAGVVIGLGVMALGCHALIPRFASLGAAWATVLGYVALAIFFVLRYFDEFRHLVFGLLVAAVVATGLWVVADFYRDVSLQGAVFGFIVSSTLYVGALTALRVVRLGDIQKLWAAFRHPA